MKKLDKYIITLCFLFGLVGRMQAQQPSYYVVGEKTCAGVDIYSIVQDDKGDIWLSTNQGLLRYDGYTFHHYTSDQLKSTSLFGLKKDREGNVYCNNLVGQIFRIAGDSLQLFAQVPDSLLFNYLEFNFDNRNRLVFKTNHYYEVNEQGDIQLVLEDEELVVKKIPFTNKDELILADAAQNRILYYKNGLLRVEQKPNFDVLPSKMRLFFNIVKKDETSFIYGQRMPSVYKEVSGSWAQIAFEDFNSRQTGWNTFILSNQSIWLANERNGARVFDMEGRASHQGRTLLPRYRISCFLEDQEGNLWLPTLGKGIIIIPNQSFVDYRNHPLLKEDDIQSAVVDKRGNLYLGGISGIVYQVKGSDIRIFKSGTDKISFLKYLEDEDALVFGSEKMELSDNLRRSTVNVFGKAKDVARVGSEQYLIATFSGIEFLDNQNNFNSPIVRHLKTFQDIYVNNSNYLSFPIGRTIALAWDKQHQFIWAGTNKGLKLIQPDTTHLITLYDQPITATSLLYKEDKIWVATKNKGVLVYEKDSLLLQLNAENGLLSNDIQKIIRKDSSLYVISKAGLQVYNIQHKTFRNYTQSDGLLSSYLLDFAVKDTIAWLVFNNGVQTIPLNKIEESKDSLNLNIHQVSVNGKPVSTNEMGRFDYDQNEIVFELMVKGYRHRGLLSYRYQLEGWKNEWTENEFLNNQVAYKSLPPGSYRFLVEAIGQNGATSPVQSYAFSIKTPFWMTGGFYLICVTVISIIIAGIFKFREYLLTQRLQLENKLKTSEVTALKAQMNPHFIFNTLNSIQDLILMDDIRASNKFLGKFADLMRMVLSASGKNQIPLSKEISALELYLEMETLRFGDEFTAQIKTALSPTQMDEIEVPSLLIQPYVENAIKHGLLHKKGEKKVIVHFYLKDEALHCTITDNGIGRTKSAEIKARRKQQHLSFATTANQKRIDLINAANSKKIKIAIHDAYPEQSNSGTVVHIIFPSC